MWKSLIIYCLAAITTTYAASCRWCKPPDIVACGATTTNDWTLVRAIGPEKKTWFNNRDNVQGTDPAIDDGAYQFNIGSFETAVPGFNQYLFVTGDCSLFLTTGKDAIGGFNGQYYGYSQRNICSSSERDTPYKAGWYNRAGCCLEDPWISTVDHGAAVGAGKMVYGEHNFGGPHAANVVGPKRGVYIFIRNAGRLDANGCAPVSQARQYIVQNKKTTGQDAERICQKEFSSTLATVVSEQDYVNMANAKKAAGVPVEQSVWVGLSDRYGEDNFEWDDGTKCENSNGDCIRSNNDPSPQWGVGEPNNWGLSSDGSGEDCVEFYNPKPGQPRPWFNDLPCKQANWARNVACNKPKPCVPLIEGRSAIMSGDPHFVTWNHVSHHFQGAINTDGEEQFYLSTACDVNNKYIQPFSVLGAFKEWGARSVTLLEYITIALYDDDETYYFFVTTSAGKNKYGKASDGITSLYNANAPGLQTYNRGKTPIGSRFEFEFVYIDANQLKINLYIKQGQKQCAINIYMRTEWVAPGDAYRMHFFEMKPPQCYKCTTCGLLGDFQTPNGKRSILRCDGDRQDISGAAHWMPGPIAYDATGWSWSKKFVDDGCRGGKTEPGSIDARAVAACTGDIETQAKQKCQSAQNAQTCCSANNDIREFCEDLKEDCVIDACIALQMGTSIDQTVRNEFSLPAQSECQRLGIAAYSPGLFNFDIDNEYMFDANGNTIRISSIFVYILAGLLILNIICCAVSFYQKRGNKNRYKVVSVESTDADTDAENRVLVK